MLTTLVMCLLGAPTPIEDGLVINRVGRSGRVPFFTDVVEQRLVRGDDPLQPIDGREWVAVQAGENGTFNDRRLRGGYLATTVEHDRDEVLLLDARGHRHVMVNGVARGGDVYDTGWALVPIDLREGTNHLLFKGGRGGIRASIVEPPAPVFVQSRDITKPDVIRGEGEVLLGVIVTNTTHESVSPFLIARTEDGGARTTMLDPIPPVSSRKVAAWVSPGSPDGDTCAVTIDLQVDGEVLHRAEVSLRVRDPGQKHVRTFVSDVEDSVQYYGVTPRAEGGEGDRLFLTLHGAGVQGKRQAASYRHRDSGWIVAPTNRRHFGFDWEDWGRMDALEVLDQASRRFGTDPRKTVLTGHSMGGHGTWSLGALFPDTFCAIAPSAGWRDFWSYGGAYAAEDPDEIESIFLRATLPSRTLEMKANYANRGIYVLHGDADETVAVDQARFMKRTLLADHTDFAYFERPGAGHWWGNQCMDWEPLMTFLEQHERRDARSFEFVTPNPGVSATCFWVTVEQQIEPLLPSSIRASIEGDTLRLETGNVRTFSIHDVPRSEESTTLTIDDETLDHDWSDATFRVEGDSWSVIDGIDPFEKSPARSSAFKQAFTNHMIFVHATGGTPEENRWSYEKARYDAETFWFRGNGGVRLVADRDLGDHDGNLVLYGNADTNLAWSRLAPGAPRLDRSGFHFDGRHVEGDDVGAIFMYPASPDTAAGPDDLIAVVGGSGLEGCRATMQLPYFVSGVHYPDWTVFRSNIYTDGTDAVEGAGWYDNDWGPGPRTWR